MLKIRNLRVSTLGHSNISPNDTLLLQLSELELKAGEVVTLMGPSGVGKSTLLRWILGEPLPEFHITGELILNGADISKQPIAQRQLGLMFQSGGLFPHMTVAENCLFAQRPRSLRSRNEQTDLAISQLDALGLKTKWNAYPQYLSGGQYSRIALLCALLAEPKVMLLDEPFSALDANLRAEVRDWAFQRLGESEIPTLLVTHDRNDARGRIITVNNNREIVDA